VLSLHPVRKLSPTPPLTWIIHEAWLVHAMILRIQTLLLPVQTLVLGGH
jgi:hypothetical protein